MASRQVRRAGPCDRALLAALHAGCFESAGDEIWDEPAIATLLETPGIFAYLTVTRDDEPAGMAIARIAGDDSEILTMGILPDCRRQGFGSSLIAAAAAHAWENGAIALFLEVAEDNLPARALYRSGGFRPIGRRADYYRRGTGRVDAILLRQDLSPPSDGEPAEDSGPG